jgi:hypothetical protein
MSVTVDKDCVKRPECRLCTISRITGKTKEEEDKENREIYWNNVLYNIFSSLGFITVGFCFGLIIMLIRMAIEQ